MNYISTRGDQSPHLASAAMVKGLAEDGGLFVPQLFPTPYLDSLDELRNLRYEDLAYEVMKHFITDFSEDELKSCIRNAYSPEKFDDESIAPLIKSRGVYFMELFHGRTLAFKDMALSILPYLMKTSLEKNNIEKEVLILIATSGDTGKAAMEGFKNVDGINVMVFYPKDGVSDVQKLQMVTQGDRNVKAVAIEGNFDDCQNAVKSIFADKALNEELNQEGILLSSANSINIGRLIPQIVYYFHGYLGLLDSNIIKEGEKVNFCVPTGNFGNILAGYYAKKMGLPVNRLICASNVNNVLYDFFEEGKYDANRELVVTKSPSMDIIISSNLERLLYHLNGATDKLMGDLKNHKEFNFDANLLSDEGFAGGYATDDMCLKVISEVFEDTGYIMDTHTAVAYKAYLDYAHGKDETKTIILSTASPYKFAGSVMQAINESYSLLSDTDLIKEVAYLLAEDVPEQIRDLDLKPVYSKDEIGRDEIRDFVMRYCER